MNIVINNGGSVSSRFWTAAVRVSDRFDLEKALKAVTISHPLAKDADAETLLLYAYDLCFEELREVLDIRSCDCDSWQTAVERLVNQYPKLKEEAELREHVYQNRLSTLRRDIDEEREEVYRLRAERVFNQGSTNAVDLEQAHYNAIVAQLKELENEASAHSVAAFERTYAAQLEAAKAVFKDKCEFVTMLNNWKSEVVAYVRNAKNASNDANKALTESYLIEPRHIEIR